MCILYTSIYQIQMAGVYPAICIKYYSYKNELQLESIRYHSIFLDNNNAIFHGI